MLSRWPAADSGFARQFPQHLGIDSLSRLSPCANDARFFAPPPPLCTGVISLLQPSGDVMQLFDDVMLLAEGWVGGVPAAQLGSGLTLAVGTAEFPAL